MTVLNPENTRTQATDALATLIHAAILADFADDGNPDEYDEWWTTPRHMADGLTPAILAALDGWMLVPTAEFQSMRSERDEAQMEFADAMREVKQLRARYASLEERCD
jgi:hypothetical protein